MNQILAGGLTVCDIIAILWGAQRASRADRPELKHKSVMDGRTGERSMNAKKRQNPDVVLIHVGDDEMARYPAGVRDAVNRLVEELDEAKRRSADPKPLAEIARDVTEVVRALPEGRNPLSDEQLETLRTSLEHRAAEIREFDAKPFIGQIVNPPICNPVVVVCGTIMPMPSRFWPDFWRRNPVDPRA